MHKICVNIPQLSSIMHIFDRNLSKYCTYYARQIRLKRINGDRGLQHGSPDNGDRRPPPSSMMPALAGYCVRGETLCVSVRVIICACMCLCMCV